MFYLYAKVIAYVCVRPRDGMKVEVISRTRDFLYSRKMYKWDW